MTLKPTATYQTGNGLTVCEKIIPDGTVWKDEAKAKAAKFAAGALYKKQKKLCGTGKPECVTVHTTDDLPQVEDDAEQYARATYNNNMGDVVVHYYIDETDCWHILADETVGWHAADGVNGPGNTKSVAIEIIMDGSGSAADLAAEDRGAKLAAILLRRYGLGTDRLRTHRDWYPRKYCPAYILPHWDSFRGKVGTYLAGMEAAEGVNENAAPEQTDADRRTFYRVQVGFYGVKANAEAMRQRLKQAGFPAIIKEEKV